MENDSSTSSQTLETSRLKSSEILETDQRFLLASSVKPYEIRNDNGKLFKISKIFRFTNLKISTMMH